MGEDVVVVRAGVPGGLSNIDIFATAGGNYRTVVREFTTTANASGQIVVTLATITDNASISGIEILR